MSCTPVRPEMTLMSGPVADAADQDGGEFVQGRASAVAAVGLSGSDGSSRAW
jgi:hypothetical protein